MFHHLSTSIREREVTETLALALGVAEKLGVSRVTGTTFLDQVGIPVYIGVRPGASRGSLCVSAGKGLTMTEAKVGACMEAIEFALSEPANSASKIIGSHYRDVLNASENPEELLRLCPIAGKAIDLSAEVPCVSALDLISGEEYLVPAELAFVPFELPDETFGNHTNGLASGNSFAEACMHGIFEVIERDILSFEMVKDTSVLVNHSEVGSCQAELMRIQDAQLNVVIRMVPNYYRLPFFAVSIIDNNQRHPAYINTGFGLHPDYQIAVIRALTEAAQSRLTFIHGTRDDLSEKIAIYEAISGEQLRELFQVKVDHLSRKSKESNILHGDFARIHGLDLPGYLNNLLDFLKSIGIDKILAIRHTRPKDPLQVVKIVIPGMEFFNPESQRIGSRLRNYAQYVKSGTFCGSKFEFQCKGFGEGFRD